MSKLPENIKKWLPGSLLLLTLLLMTSCTETIEQNGVTAPKSIVIRDVANTVDLADGLKVEMNGVYYNSKDKGILTGTPVLNWNNDLLNIYTGEDNTTYALKGGVRNDSLVFIGTSLDASKKVKLEAAFAGAQDMSTRITGGNITFKASLFTFNGNLIEASQLTLKRKILNNLNNFTIIIHDGGGDDTYSPNSTGGIKHSALTGANGMELDVSLSQDGIPFCFHDQDFRFDNINSDFCVGPVSNFKMEDIKLLTLLPDGSKVPTLDEALNLIVTTTNFKTVWLDIKNSGAIVPAADLIKKYKTKAESLSKNIEIFIGLPSSEAVNVYKTASLSQSAKILTELPPDVVQEINADAWGPQWDTGNYTPDQISYVHSLGKIVFCWIVDDPSFFQYFAGNSKPDGIITNNPQKMLYEFFSQNN